MVPKSKLQRWFTDFSLTITDQSLSLGAEDEGVQERRRPERRLLSGIKPWMQFPMNVSQTAMIHNV